MESPRVRTIDSRSRVLPLVEIKGRSCGKERWSFHRSLSWKNRRISFTGEKKDVNPRSCSGISLELTRRLWRRRTDSLLLSFRLPGNWTPTNHHFLPFTNRTETLSGTLESHLSVLQSSSTYHQSKSPLIVITDVCWSTNKDK